MENAIIANAKVISLIHLISSVFAVDVDQNNRSHLFIITKNGAKVTPNLS